MAGIKQFPQFCENPSKPEGIEKKRRNLKNYEKEAVDCLTGEHFAFRPLKTEYTHVDTAPYTKLFNEALPSIKDLTVPGLKVWCYILANLKPNKDYVLIKEKSCMAYCGYDGKSNYYKGLANLLEKNIIYRMTGSESVYFINVNFIFNGDRKKLIDDSECYED